MTSRGRLGLLLTCLAGVFPSQAQQSTHLFGLILDPSSAGVPGATVSVVHEETGFRRVARSQPDGGYVVSSLEPGVYKVTVRKEGFRAMVRFGVKLDVSQLARVDFTLPLGSMHEAITVEGGAPPLNSEDASVGTLVGHERIEHLPLNGRGLLSLLELAPGTVVTPATRGEAGQFTANGQRPNTNYFTVDGVSVNTGVSGGGLPAQCTGGALPGMTAFGSFHGLISLEALQEFRVQTSTLTPEFGRMPGAQVSLSSRSGSNELHGSLFHYFRHEKLDANDWFANRHGDGRAPLRANDFGGTLGGALRRDRTFFFLSYEGMRLRQPFAWRAPAPSADLRAGAAPWVQAVLNLFPEPNGPELSPGLAEWTGRNNRPTRLDAGGLRLDHAVTPNITAFGRLNWAPSSNEFGSSQVNQLKLRAASLTLGANVRLAHGLVLDTRNIVARASGGSLWRQGGAPEASDCSLEPVTSYFFRVPGLCDYFFRFSIAGVGQVASGREGRRRQTQWQLLQTVSLSAGAHYLRLGGDHQRLAAAYSDASGAFSLIAESLDDLMAGRNLWTATSAPQEGRSVLKELSLFAQDTWRVTTRLTATYGLRWEFSPAPIPEQPVYFPNPQAGFVGLSRRAIWPRRYSNFAPRAGLAFRPAAGKETVIRAGLGLYYDTSLSIATDLVNGGPLSVRQYGSSKHAPFSMLMSYGFAPDLRLPLVKHWNASIEHAFAGRDVVSVGYAGSGSRSLIRREMGGPESSEVFLLALATNHGSADYHGLQIQYRRRVARRLQSLVSYAWSHSLDDSSSDSALHWVGTGVTRAQDRASSDFDVRHTLTAAFTFEDPAGPGVSRPARLLRGWAIDGIFRARTGFPINVLNAENAMGVSFANVFRPGLVPGVAVWVSDRSAPGGRRLNREAFRSAPESEQGNLGRNALTGFGMSQLDLALRRELVRHERHWLQLRLEAFNAFNRPNHADPGRFLASPLFGQPSSMLNLMLGTGSPGSGLAPMFQTGGARSLQVVLRYGF